ncbi:MBL fold metallo-hydrolase [Paraburkholderia sediminicola]|uniref:MBL fold metallo-hydrolase n=1 Tax=Paraburkholderia sediminicola TaxID=458836 RepID=UPI000EB0F84D
MLIQEKNSVPEFKKWKIGAVTVTRITEIETFALPPEEWFPIDAEVIKKHAWLRPYFADEDGRVLLTVQAFVIESAGLKIMVDPCVGNDRSRQGEMWANRSGPFLEHLALAGFPCDSIDVVLCTHLHFDHVGWNTRLVDGEWIPTFPNARYLFARTEYENAKSQQSFNAKATFADSIKPILDAGLAELVETNHPLNEEVWLEPTPGHTPGHCTINISSGGEKAVMTGDMIHSPFQASEPDVSTHFCGDKVLANLTRRAFLTKACAEQALVLGTHFPEPTGVRICQHETAWRAYKA